MKFKLKSIIWGTGAYCREKMKYMERMYEIVAYVEREKKVFCGRETILPKEIKDYQYDKIIILSNHYLEIIPEILKVYGVQPDKIVPGIVCRPYLPGELEVMSDCAQITVREDGTLLYVHDNKDCFIISQNKDWTPVRNLLCREENSEILKALSPYPVGKLFGGDRGGSICRYYVDKFLRKNQSLIKGNVLEIGDRTYTWQFGEMVECSHCLHFDREFVSGTEEDFYGDLRNGDGLRTGFYDCIILTQVLNFVEDIRNVPKLLINSLKPGGTLLITVSGITPVSRYDMDRWGHFWNFTDAGIRRMFSLEHTECLIETYGNYKVACAFLGGMSYTELEEEELTYKDEDFQVFISAVVRKQ